MTVLIIQCSSEFRCKESGDCPACRGCIKGGGLPGGGTIKSCISGITVVVSDYALQSLLAQAHKD